MDSNNVRARTAGLQALEEGAALLDLSGRGRIRALGEDRARLLHAMTTNHIQQLRSGDGVYAFFLNAQGRIQADANVLCFEDYLLLDTEPETRPVILEHLDRFIIADDVTLGDVTEETFCLGLEGAGALGLARSIGMPVPGAPGAHAEWAKRTVAALSFTGQPGVRVFGVSALRRETEDVLREAGAVRATEEEARQARIRNFKPRFGDDITDATLPQETQQMQAMHFSKGCYLGQEIVERIRSRGHVNKQLMGFRLEGGGEPSGKLLADGKEAGEVTSWAAVEGLVYGLGYVRVPYNRPGAQVHVGGGEATLFPPAGVSGAA